LSLVPPTVGEETFNMVGQFNTVMLYVLENAINDYQSAPVWSGFENVLPIAQNDGFDFTYSQTEGNAKVIGYHGESETLNIPSSIIYNGNAYPVTSIGDWAFSDNQHIKSVSFPDNITTIGEAAFYNCNNLSGDLMIPNTVESIGSWAFEYCSQIKSVLIGNSVTSIGARAFYGCSGITGPVILGNSITSIGMFAFSGCSKIKEIWSMNVTPPSCGLYPFMSININIPVYVPCGAQSDYESASRWSIFTDYHEIPSCLVVKTSSEVLGEASVVQYGNCENNESIVHAEPYFGAVFTGWKVNGEQVSTEMDYTFPLTDDMVLTAHFEPAPNHFVFVGATNQWSDPSNWEPNGLPTATSTVGVWGNVEIDGNICVNSLVVYGSYTVTIQPNSSLTVLDTLVTPNASSLVVKEGGELIHSCNGVLATIKKSISLYTEGERNGWNFVALPLAGIQEVSLIENLTNTDYDLYYYDEPTKYWMNQKVAANDFTELESGKGYLYANKGEMRTVFSFDDGMDGWTTISPEGNNSSWHHVLNASGSHSGGGHVSSAISWHNVNGNYFSDDDYFVSPLVQFTGSSSISFWVYTMNWIYEHFAVAVSTTGNTNASDFTTIHEFMPFEKSKVEGDSLRGGIWVRYTVDLSQYANQTGYIAIRHYECTDMQHTLRVDDVELSGMGNMRNPVELSFVGELKSGSITVSVPLSYSITAGSLKGLNLVGNPFVCNAYLLDENNEALPFFKMNDTGDSNVAVQAGTPIKPCEGVFVFCPNDRQLHSAIFTTTAPANIGEAQTVPEMLLPIHDLLVNQNASHTNSVTQTISLISGWNWCSFNVEITLDDLKTALVTALPNANAITIKSKDNGIVTYNGSIWRGQLTTLDLTQMYRISVGNACEISLEGILINPANHPVTIHNGANWIAFPLSESMSLNDVFGGFAVPGDVVKSKNNGVATYNGTSWRGSLNTLEPGQGYIFNSNVQSDRTFTFPIGAK